MEEVKLGKDREGQACSLCSPNLKSWIRPWLLLTAVIAANMKLVHWAFIQTTSTGQGWVSSCPDPLRFIKYNSSSIKTAASITVLCCRHLCALTLLRTECQLVTVGHPSLTYIFDFWHSDTLALSRERQSVWMSEIKMYVMPEWHWTRQNVTIWRQSRHCALKVQARTASL